MEAESMSKKSLKISIEEEVLEKAKKHIPNLDWVYITDINVNTNSWQEVLKAYTENNDE